MSLAEQNQHHWLRTLVTRYRIDTTFPALPDNGWSVFRSGLTTHREEFYYDGYRARWLGKATTWLTFSAPSSRSGHLDYHSGRQSSSTLGYLLPYDMVLVGMWLLRNATGALETYRATANGTDKAQTSFNAIGDTKSYNLSTLNITFTSGDIVGCRLLSGSTVGATTVSLMFRRYNPT